jgi:hypothetical protein
MSHPSAVRPPLWTCHVLSASYWPEECARSRGSIHAAGLTGYDDMTEVVILAAGDTERDFATRAFGVPAFTAVTPTMKGTHVVVVDGPGNSTLTDAGQKLEGGIATGIFPAWPRSAKLVLCRTITNIPTCRRRNCVCVRLRLFCAKRVI